LSASTCIFHDGTALQEGAENRKGKLIPVRKIKASGMGKHLKVQFGEILPWVAPGPIYFPFMDSMWRRAKLTSSRPVPKRFRKGPEVNPGLHQNPLGAILDVKSGTRKWPKQNITSRLNSSKTMGRGVGSRSAPGYLRRMSGVSFRRHFDTLWSITNAQFEYNSNLISNTIRIQQ
jgi:hypothetical protein